MKNKIKNITQILLLTTFFLSQTASSSCPVDFPEPGVISTHVEQADIVSGKVKLKDVVDIGKNFFIAKFNICDGQGRPATTGAGDKRLPDQPEFIRTSAPESDSCSGCHAQPFVGGSGDIVANVFVLAQALDPVTESVSGQFSNERNTLGMHGSGAIEMLAREMTADLQQQITGLSDGNHTLVTKGVDFEVTISNGAVTEAKGVNTDLIIRPFHQAGVVVSLREFTVNAMNHHHGMQAEERFDLNPAKGFDPDFDEDGVQRELTIGDITATTIFQAQLSVPQQVMPTSPTEMTQVEAGEQLFDSIGCTSCHVPSLELDSPVFSEPNPYNPPGTFYDAGSVISWNMTTTGNLPRLDKKGNTIEVKAYTDLKRHNLCDEEGSPDAIRFFCNETLAQGRPDQDGRPGQEFFLTRKLWDVGSSAPFGHRGDITTITEAILYHGGEGRISRDAFASLASTDQASIIKFLKTLQIVEHSTLKSFLVDVLAGL
jgi:hypothetical protein